MIPRCKSQGLHPTMSSVRYGTARSLALVLLCLADLGACVRAPRLPMATMTDSMTDQPTAPVLERVLSLDDIRSELWRRERTIAFRPSTLVEREIISAIVESLIAGAATGDAPLPQLAHKAGTIGFRLQAWRVADQRYWALIEAEDDRRGAGAYIIRVGARARAPSVLLQAPHAFFDLGTSDLSVGLFFADNPWLVGLFTNTLHRYWDDTGDYQQRERSPADVCHRTDHVFQYATDGAARAMGALIVIQLHGFADARRRPDAIVSSGDPVQSTPLVERIALALRPALGDVRRFPEDIDELGGTTNAQGRLLSTSRRARFVHLELSARLRRKLRRTPEMLDSMGKALLEGALEPPAGGTEATR